MKIAIDIETIPDQSENAIDEIMETLVVKAPDLTKPKLIELLGLDPKAGKFKTVPELKELWLSTNEHTAKREQAEQKWLKTSFDGAKGQICGICISFIGVDSECVYKFSGDEKEILTELNNAIFDKSKSEATKPYFIGHNSISFDIPFLHKRFIINKIKPKFELVAHGKHNYTAFDTMTEWAGFGQRISMDNLAKAIGVSGKTEGMDGSQVWPEYQKGNIDKIMDYCADDVLCTKYIYKRLTFS